MPLKTASEAIPALEAGIYVMELVRLEDADPGQFGPLIRWVFHCWDMVSHQQVRIDSGDDAGQPYEFWAVSSESMTPRSKARGWAEALLGRKVEAGEEVSTTMIGKRGLAVVTVTDEGYARIEAGALSPYKPKPGVVLEGDEA